VIRLFEIAVLLVIAIGLRRRDWIAGAGWAQLALIAGLAWLMPWYLVWALPLAALSQSTALRRTVMIFTTFLLLTFLPITGQFLASHGFNPQTTPVGRAEARFEQSLQWQHHPHRPAADLRSATIAHRCSDCSRYVAPTA
jgi:hypothetical protein